MIIKIRIFKVFFLLLNPKSLLIFLKYRTVLSLEHKSIIEGLNINNVIDVGANNGQFSLLINLLFPKIKITAFEPIKECCDKYKKIFSSNNNVTCINVALGNKKKNLDLYVTQDTDSSSLMMPYVCSSIFRGANLNKKIKVNLETGYSAFANLDLNDCLLKIDVQGYELEVLKGLASKIGLIKYIFIELSHIELYKNQPLFPEVLEQLYLYPLI